MPRSAIATGDVDDAGSPGEIMAAICKPPPLLDVLKVLAARRGVRHGIAEQLYPSEVPTEGDLPSDRALLLSSRVLVKEAHALIWQCQEAIRTTMIAMGESQALLQESKRIIARMGMVTSD
jgi:hypothetical protein